MPEDQEEEEQQVLRKLRPKIPDHSDDHPVAENMKERKDVSDYGFRQTLVRFELWGAHEEHSLPSSLAQ